MSLLRIQLGKKTICFLALLVIVAIGMGIFFLFVENELHEDAHSWKNAIVANGEECARVGM